MTEAEKERAAVVAYIQKKANEWAGPLYDSPERAVVLREAAKAIEQRDHLKEQTDGQG